MEETLPENSMSGGKILLDLLWKGKSFTFPESNGGDQKWLTITFLPVQVGGQLVSTESSSKSLSSAHLCVKI